MPILRHVYLRLKPEHQTEPELARVREASLALAGVPGVLDVSVLVPADAHARAAWDVCLVLRFSDPEAVEAYRTHPDHRRYVDDVLSPRLAVLKAWNFDMPETP